MEYEFHPYANIFPLVDTRSKEFIDLCKSIKELGNKIPVILYQGKILDGRTRYLCKREDDSIELLPFEEFTGSDAEALAYSLALNNERRNLNQSQRALSAWYYARQRVDLQRKEADKKAMEVFRAGEKYIKIIAKLQKELMTNPHIRLLLHGIESGELSVKDANDILTSNVPVKEWGDAAADIEVCKARIKDAKEVKKQEKKQVAEAVELNGAIGELNKAKANGKVIPYPVILINPPRSMTIEDLAAIEVPVEKNGFVFLWSQLCELKDKIEVLEGWGFSYNIAYVWTITGKQDAMLLLLGQKGSGVTIQKDKMMPMAQGASAEEGEPPLIFKEGITNMFPNFPKLDLFGKGKDTKGWFHGGNPIEEVKPKTNGDGRRSKKAKSATETTETETTEETVITETA